MKWCNICRIRLNPQKTKVLNFSNKKHFIMDCSIKMDSINLKAKKTVKFLGVTFDYKLMFEEQIKYKVYNLQHVASSFYSLKCHQ